MSTEQFTPFDIETGSADDLYHLPPGTAEYVRLVGYGTTTGPLPPHASRPERPTVTVNGNLFDFPALDRHCSIPVEGTIPFSRDLRTAAFQQRIRPLDARRHEFAQPCGIAQVQHAHTAARDLVLVRHADAASSRTDRLARGARLVEQLVIRHHQVRALAHIQPAFHVEAVGDKLVDLDEQRLRIEHC